MANPRLVQTLEHYHANLKIETNRRGFHDLVANDCIPFDYRLLDLELAKATKNNANKN